MADDVFGAMIERVAIGVDERVAEEFVGLCLEILAEGARTRASASRSTSPTRECARFRPMSSRSRPRLAATARRRWQRPPSRS